MSINGKHQIIAIVATDKNNAIGKDNKLQWNNPNDMKHFKRTTDGHVVVMGRKTFESIGKPLPNRINIVLTKNNSFKPPEGVLVFNHQSEVFDYITSHNVPKTFIIGGEQIYKLFKNHYNKIIRTIVPDVIVKPDAFFIEIDSKLYDSVTVYSDSTMTLEHHDLKLTV